MNWIDLVLWSVIFYGYTKLIFRHCDQGHPTLLFYLEQKVDALFFLIVFVVFWSLFFIHRDVYHNIEALDPEKLSVFRTVREITGK